MASALREAGWGVCPPDQYIPDMDSGFMELWRQAEPYTMISIERAWALAQAAVYVCRSNIAGDVVECGVWRGGSCLLAAQILANENNSEKNLWLYDTFEGMPEPGGEDCIASSGQPVKEKNPQGWWAVSLKAVKQNLRDSTLAADRFKFIQGRVEDTLKTRYPEQISLLRLDTDWYESTRCEMEVLYPRLSSGGVLIIDDYGHFTGARKAVDEYFQHRGIIPLLHRSDYTGRVMVKP
ncbi:MAG: hypothetical protein B0D92_08240 [Spirochaeta sp. LUC14_002_19_P3]|nr:MAG: hypothetical protein B0D92_08240 [Spirochaeta sp. LUC14_002_19_P3]